MHLSVAAAIGCCSYQLLQLSVAASIGCCSFQSLQQLVAAAIVVVDAAVVAALFLRPEDVFSPLPHLIHRFLYMRRYK